MAAFGNFVWLDLQTPDLEGGQAFYTKLLGWEVQEGNMGGMPYHMFRHGQDHIGGVMQLPPELQAQGVPPHWLSYTFVESVDATTERALELGANVIVPPTDIPQIGRFSILTDPQGAAFALYSSIDPSQTTVNRGPGFPAWYELTTSDHRAAKEFYMQIAGFVPDQVMDMGQAGPDQGMDDPGTYDLFKAADPNGPAIGGMWTAPASLGIPPHWLPYFEVADIEASVARVKELGGTVLNGPMQVPDGSHVAQCIDPQGAAFGLNQR